MKTGQMKLLSFALAVAMSFTAVAAEAGTTTKKRRTSDKVSTSQSAVGRSGAWGIGYQSIAIGGGAGADSAVSALMEMSDISALQFLAGISSTTPFSFGLGGIFRQTMVGNNRSGFHVGGGLTLASIGGQVDPVTGDEESTMVIDLRGLAGVHFSIDKVVFSFDGGPVLSIVDGDSNLSLAPYSALLGFSVHYML